LVLGLPRGGVPVAAEVARELGASLDVLVVRKLGAPSQPEVAIGAIGPDGAVLLHAHGRALDPETLDRIRRRELAELERRVRAYRGDRGPSCSKDDASCSSTTASRPVRRRWWRCRPPAPRGPRRSSWRLPWPRRTRATRWPRSRIG